MGELYSTYTNVGTHIAITSDTVITFTSLASNVHEYVYKDHGVGYFSGYRRFDFDVKITGYNAGATNSTIFFWGLSDAINDFGQQSAANNSHFALFVYYNGTTRYIGLREKDGTAAAYDAYFTLNPALNTSYYVSIIRDTSVGTYGTLYAYIYSDAARNNLLETVSLTLHTSVKNFRYLYALTSNYAGPSFTDWASGTSENLAKIAAAISVPKANFNFTGKIPNLNTAIPIPKANFNFTPKVPAALVNAYTTIAVPSKTFNFSRFVPIIRIAADRNINVPVKTFNFTSFTPNINLLKTVILPPKVNFNFLTYSPAVILTNSQEEITWELYDTSGIPIIGAVAKLRVRQRETGKTLNWANNTFVLGGGAQPSANMTDVDTGLYPGLYRAVITIGNWPNGWYQATATYQTVTDAAMTAGSNVLTSVSNSWQSGDVGKSITVNGAGAAGAKFTTTIATFVSAGQVTLAVAASTTVSGTLAAWGTAQNGIIEFLIRGGQMVESYNSANLDVAVSSRVSQADNRLTFLDAYISTRLAAAGYTAPDNAGIAAVKAKTDTISWTDVTSVLAIVTLLQKYVKNKKEIKQVGGVSTLYIYDNDGTTPIAQQVLKDKSGLDISPIAAGIMNISERSSV